MGLTVIDSIADIVSLLLGGCSDWKQYGDVNVVEQGDLVLFDYSALAAINNRWNYFERVSRGLIINKITGEVVARPFDKFFNWDGVNHYTKAPIKYVYEKMDGSLGILYRKNGRFLISTRGSFTSEQALWATNYISDKDFTWLPSKYTLLFEIIYPENRVVVDYKGQSGLVLLAARNRFDGDYASEELLERYANEGGFGRPSKFHFSNPSSITSVLPSLSKDEEGFVATFKDGQMFKFKGDTYIRLHHIKHHLSFKNTLELVKNNEIEAFLKDLPDEFMEQVIEWVQTIEDRLSFIKDICAKADNEAPKSSRKEFAAFVLKNYPRYANYIFPYHDGKDISQLVYKNEF